MLGAVVTTWYIYVGQCGYCSDIRPRKHVFSSSLNLADFLTLAPHITKVLQLVPLLCMAHVPCIFPCVAVVAHLERSEEIHLKLEREDEEGRDKHCAHREKRESGQDQGLRRRGRANASRHGGSNNNSSVNSSTARHAGGITGSWRMHDTYEY